MSAKTGQQQQGRRTPLTLTAASAKQQFNKPTPGSNVNSGNTKNDNKNTKDQKTAQPTVEIKEAVQKDIKKQANVVEKKQQQQNTAAVVDTKKQEEKKQPNGVGKSNNGNTTTAKDKQQQQQNGKEDKTNENVKKKETTEKLEKSEKSAPVPTTEEKKEVVIVLEKEIQSNKNSEKEQQSTRKSEKIVKPKKNDVETVEPNKIENSSEAEKMDVSNTATDKKSAPATPTKPVVAPTEKKTPTPTKATQKVDNLTPIKTSEKAITPVKLTTTPTTTIIVNDDVEMESLVVDPSPIKAPNPTATSTPGKLTMNKRASMTDIQSIMPSGGTSPDRSSCPRTFSQISGRRGIRPISDYTPSHLQNNMLFRESYRRINTELDVTSTTNTSLNVTVGSEVPNNSSFSFFGRGRKRDRTPPQSQSAIELQTDGELSPPKRARLDMHGFFSAVSSPLSLLRSRFSKASIQSSTPVKLDLKLTAEDECEVQNVSGISIEEELPTGEEVTDVDDITVGNEAGLETPKKSSPVKSESKVDTEDLLKTNMEKCAANLVLEKATSSAIDGSENTDDIKFTETPIIGSIGDPSGKNKRCIIM